MSAQIPDSHVELLTGPYYTTITTIMPDGQPQSTVVWCDYDGEYIRINSAVGRKKDENLRRDPRVTLMAMDHHNGYFWIEVRGEVVETTLEGATDHIHQLSELYTGQKYYGGFAPAEREHQETRIMYKIKPVKVNANGSKDMNPAPMRV